MMEGSSVKLQLCGCCDHWNCVSFPFLPMAAVPHFLAFLTDGSLKGSFDKISDKVGNALIDFFEMAWDTAVEAATLSPRLLVIISVLGTFALGFILLRARSFLIRASDIRGDCYAAKDRYVKARLLLPAGSRMKFFGWVCLGLFVFAVVFFGIFVFHGVFPAEPPDVFRGR